MQTLHGTPFSLDKKIDTVKINNQIWYQQAQDKLWSLKLCTKGIWSLVSVYVSLFAFLSHVVC